jgi:predicted PurR-regulated permease PerM
MTSGTTSGDSTRPSTDDPARRRSGGATGAAGEDAAAGAGPDPVRAAGSTGEADPIVDHEVRRREAGVDEDNPFGRLGRPLNHRSPFRVGFSAAVGVGLAYLLYRAIVNAQHQLVLVAVAAFLAIGLNPTVSRLERVGMRRGLAVGLVFLATAGFFALFGYAILPPVVEQVSKFIDAIPDYLRDLQRNETVHQVDQKYHVIERVQQYLTSGDVGSTAAESVIGVGKALASTFFDGLTVLILTLYFLSSFNGIKRTVYRLMPRSRRARAALLGDEILSRVGGYVAGAFVIALIAGTSTLIWLTILGVPYPLALALLVTITDVIPLVGATIGAVLVTTVAFFVSLPVGIATAIFYLVYQQVENYVVYPVVYRRAVELSPFTTIVAVLIAGSLLGVVGAILAVPFAAVIKIVLREAGAPRRTRMAALRNP